jgi:hypothetical protein
LRKYQEKNNMLVKSGTPKLGRVMKQVMQWLRVAKIKVFLKDKYYINTKRISINIDCLKKK